MTLTLRHLFLLIVLLAVPGNLLANRLFIYVDPDELAEAFVKRIYTTAERVEVLNLPKVREECFGAYVKVFDAALSWPDNDVVSTAVTIVYPRLRHRLDYFSKHPNQPYVLNALIWSNVFRKQLALGDTNAIDLVIEAAEKHDESALGALDGVNIPVSFKDRIVALANESSIKLRREASAIWIHNGLHHWPHSDDLLEILHRELTNRVHPKSYINRLVKELQLDFLHFKLSTVHDSQRPLWLMIAHEVLTSGICNKGEDTAVCIRLKKLLLADSVLSQAEEILHAEALLVESIYEAIVGNDRHFVIRTLSTEIGRLPSGNFSFWEAVARYTRNVGSEDLNKAFVSAAGIALRPKSLLRAVIPAPEELVNRMNEIFFDTSDDATKIMAANFLIKYVDRRAAANAMNFLLSKGVDIFKLKQLSFLTNRDIALLKNIDWSIIAGQVRSAALYDWKPLWAVTDPGLNIFLQKRLFENLLFLETADFEVIPRGLKNQLTQWLAHRSVHRKNAPAPIDLDDLLERLSSSDLDLQREARSEAIEKVKRLKTSKRSRLHEAILLSLSQETDMEIYREDLRRLSEKASKNRTAHDKATADLYRACFTVYKPSDGK